RAIAITGVILMIAAMAGCGGENGSPEKLEIALVQASGYKGEAKGTAVIDTKTGTDITINITGLDPKELYTAFFVNVKSQMFQGIGKPPYVLAVDESGTANLQAAMEKNVYKKFVRIGIYSNPGGKPIENPVGVKAALGALIKPTLPTMVLEGKLR
ncbi:MAG: hypothetical protein RBS57_21840, partial [Desulforhabdus sp.]|nr:hypothetical protein [Desulforhabdus sp.]